MMSTTTITAAAAAAVAAYILTHSLLLYNSSDSIKLTYVPASIACSQSTSKFRQMSQKGPNFIPCFPTAIPR